MINIIKHPNSYEVEWTVQGKKYKELRTQFFATLKEAKLFKRCLKNRFKITTTGV
jgi:hypothetical protein